MEISKLIHDDIAINKLTQNVRKNSPLFFRRPLKHVGRKCIASWQINNPFHPKKVKFSSNYMYVAMDYKFKEINCCIEVAGNILCNISSI